MYSNYTRKRAKKEAKHEWYNPKMVESSIGKALVVLFPDIRTTGGQANYTGEHIPLLAEDFRKANAAVMTRYRRAGFTTFGAVYKDTDDQTFSYYYDKTLFDKIIRWDLKFADIVGEAFKPAYARFMDNLRQELKTTDDAKVVVGGYHAQDCVLNFAHNLINNNINASIDLRLTNEATFLVVSHAAKRRLPSNLRKESAIEDIAIWNRKKEGLVLPKKS